MDNGEISKQLKTFLESPRALLSPNPSKQACRSVEKKIQIPYSWGGDEITALFDSAHENIKATFFNYGLLFQRYIDIHKTYKLFMSMFKINDSNCLQIFLFHRSYSAFVTSIRLASSGQIPETFPILRACIEYSLYSFLMSKDESTKIIWLNRHNDNASKKKCRNAFQIKTIFDNLKTTDSDLESDLHALYEDCIDYGAHPNERGVLPSVNIDEEFCRVIHLERGESLSMKMTLIQVARIGISVLEIFRYIFPDKYKQLELIAEIEKIKRNL